MQKLKWCLLCSAAADLFNKLMEKLLFFCLYFLCEACDWGLWMKAKSLNSTGHQQKSKAVDSKLGLTERNKNYPHFHGIALLCLAGAHPFAFPHRILKQSQFLSCCSGTQHSSGHHEHIAPCTLSLCVCNIHSLQKQLLSRMFSINSFMNSEKMHQKDDQNHLHIFDVEHSASVAWFPYSCCSQRRIVCFVL